MNACMWCAYLFLRIVAAVGEVWMRWFGANGGVVLELVDFLPNGAEVVRNNVDLVDALRDRWMRHHFRGKMNSCGGHLASGGAYCCCRTHQRGGRTFGLGDRLAYRMPLGLV